MSETSSASTSAPTQGTVKPSAANLPMQEISGEVLVEKYAKGDEQTDQDRDPPARGRMRLVTARSTQRPYSTQRLRSTQWPLPFTRRTTFSRSVDTHPPRHRASARSHASTSVASISILGNSNSPG